MILILISRVRNLTDWSGWPSGLRRHTQVQTRLTILDIQCEFWSSTEDVGSNPTPDILVWIMSAGSSINHLQITTVISNLNTKHFLSSSNN